MSDEPKNTAMSALDLGVYLSHDILRAVANPSPSLSSSSRARSHDSAAFDDAVKKLEQLTNDPKSIRIELPIGGVDDWGVNDCAIVQVAYIQEIIESLKQSQMQLPNETKRSDLKDE